MDSQKGTYVSARGTVRDRSYGIEQVFTACRMGNADLLRLVLPKVVTPFGGCAAAIDELGDSPMAVASLLGRYSCVLVSKEIFYELYCILIYLLSTISSFAASFDRF